MFVHRGNARGDADWFGCSAAILIGGLGMGFTLRTALAELPADARVTVVELVPGTQPRVVVAAFRRDPFGVPRIADRFAPDHLIACARGDKPLDDVGFSRRCCTAWRGGSHTR